MRALYYYKYFIIWLNNNFAKYTSIHIETDFIGGKNKIYNQFQ